MDAIPEWKYSTGSSLVSAMLSVRMIAEVLSSAIVTARLPLLAKFGDVKPGPSFKIGASPLGTPCQIGSDAMKPITAPIVGGHDHVHNPRSDSCAGVFLPITEAGTPSGRFDKNEPAHLAVALQHLSLVQRIKIVDGNAQAG